MLGSIVITAALLIGPQTAPQVHMTKADPIQTGIQDSAYKGKYYRKTQERVRKCIGQREGRFQYWGTGSHGKYQSTYQMTAPLLRGAAWMMGDELRQMFGKKQGNRIQYRLLHTQGKYWHRFYMDMAFYVVANWKHDGSGLRHWNGGRWVCKW